MWKHPRFDSQECKNLYIKKNIVIVAPRYDIKLQQIYIQTSLFVFSCRVPLCSNYIYSCTNTNSSAEVFFQAGAKSQYCGRQMLQWNSSSLLLTADEKFASPQF